MKNKRLLLIGIDAADWQLIDQISETHDLRFFKRLKNEGSTGLLASLNPMLSPMLWTSIATGKRPYAHGITGFTEYDEQTEKAIPIRASKRKVKAVWNILNEAGLKTNVVNWWPSYPLEKLNGVLVSNAFYASDVVDFDAVYPREYQDILSEYKLKPDEFSGELLQAFVPKANDIPEQEWEDMLKPLSALIQKTASLHNHATWLLENTEWDFQAVYYEVLDQAGHLAMKFHPPKIEDVSEEKFEWYNEIISRVYQWVDMMLERLVYLAKDADVIIVSDHGFEGGAKRIYELPDVPAAPALEHRAYGVFAAIGSNFKPGEKLYGNSLLDVTPTILKYFGLPSAEDMDGKSVNSIFRNNTTEGSIPSWELTKMKPQFIEENYVDEEVLKQLEALGYWKPVNSNLSNHINAELSYNLALSYLDGGKTIEAERTSKEAFKRYNEYRFSYIFLQIFIQQARFEEFNNFLAKMPSEYVEQPIIKMLQAQGLFYQQKPQEALEAYISLEESEVINANLYVEMARSAQIAGQLKAAAHYYEKSLQLNPDLQVALQGLSSVKLEGGNTASALTLLQQSLELQYYQPQTHYLFAVGLLQLNKTNEALQALQVCLKQAPKHKKAQLLLNKLLGKESKIDCIYIVTGFPRSGTSLMMQMLLAGGVTALADGNRQADEHNPKGYFELDKTQNLGKSAEWLKEAQGKAIKIVLPLLRFLPPDFSYKIIWMERPLQEIVLSQEIMKGRNRQDILYAFPFDLAVKMQDEESRMKKYLGQLPNTEMVSVRYHNCITNPEEVASLLNDFIGKDFNGSKALTVIDPALFRNNLGG